MVGEVSAGTSGTLVAAVWVRRGNIDHAWAFEPEERPVVGMTDAERANTLSGSGGWDFDLISWIPRCGVRTGDDSAVTAFVVC